MEEASSPSGDSVRQSRCLEPLAFKLHPLPESPNSGTLSGFAIGTPPPLSTQYTGLMKCIFCDEHFNGSVEFKDDFLRHLLQTHKFVIGDFKTVPDFRRYIEYWRLRFRGRSKTEFCSVIRTNSGETDTETSEDYYLLCDALEEDKDVREKLQIQKLKEVLEQQQLERKQTDFNFGCLFCREQFTSNRADLINHMATKHNFNIGHPDNLVYTDELLRVLHDKSDNLVCFYCENTFKDRVVLREHMRKKQHKQINPKDKKYDKYYVINYLEIGKTWEDIHTEDDGDIHDRSNSDSDWEDWTEREDASVCLFCPKTSHASDVMFHMKDIHHFDLRAIKTQLGLSFYQQVKLVNYIRRQVHQKTCPNCEKKQISTSELLKHLAESHHASSAPDVHLWDQPEFFFPTYENDRLLCCLEEVGDASKKDTEVEVIEEVTDAVVIAEDLNIEEAMDRRDYIMRELRA